MRLKIIILSLIIAVVSVYADPTTLSTEDDNATKKLQNSEITALKEKIKKLETELEMYKKVKPIASKASVPIKTSVSKKVLQGEKFVAGISEPKELSAYYTAKPQTIEVLKFKLETNGFEVIAVDEIFEKGTVISFTNEALRNTNSFLSVLHMALSKDVEIRVQNPSYFGAAFLQDKYTYGQFSETLKALEAALGEMYEVEDKLGLSSLSHYHFMLGMPRFNDQIVVAKGSDIVQSVTEANATKYISYILALPDGSTLVGHKLAQETYDYLKRIKAQNNAQIFPYEVMIKDEVAVMMSPKYYLALSLPLLSMTDFLKIASAPDKIENDIETVYQKDVDTSSDK